MNLREFTEAVDARASEMTWKESRMVFHSLARKVPKENRKEFLEIMDQVKNTCVAEGGGKSAAKMAAAQDKSEVKREYTRLKKQFAQIQEGEVFFHAQGYEDDSSSYWDRDWVYEFEDPYKIGKTYEAAARLVERCVNDGFYKTALNTFELMTDTEAGVSDGGDGFEIDFDEIIRERLISIDTDALKKSVLYGVYQNTSPKERPEVLYSYVILPFFRGVKLEEILSMGKTELPGSSRFVEEWIGFLTDKPGDVAGQFLRDAVLYQKSGDEMMEAARKGAKCHPSLLAAVLEYFEEKQDTGRQLALGQEALGLVEEKYKVRGQIALSTAQAALKTGNVELAEECWQKAFESDTNPLNYLRVAAESRDGRSYRQKALKIIDSLQPRKEASYGPERIKELETNSLSEYEKAELLFFMGDFDRAMKKCETVREGLGWSGHFIKCGLPLFLLLFLDTDTLGKGGYYAAGMAASNMGFQAREYEKGTLGALETERKNSKAAENTDSTDLFWQCFRKWKETLTPEEITGEQVGTYVTVLERLIDLRVRAIVSGQHRNHYRSVAALAAALGEVKESRGETGAKRKILLGYREVFPRHSSFHEELRAYGMPDIRKGVGKKPR